VGGCGFGWGAGKARSQKNACKSGRIPPVGCTLCWQEPMNARLFAYKPELLQTRLDFTRYKIFGNPLTEEQLPNFENAKT